MDRPEYSVLSAALFVEIRDPDFKTEDPNRVALDFSESRAPLGRPGSRAKKECPC